MKEVKSMESKKEEKGVNLQTTLSKKTHFKLQEMKLHAGKRNWPDFFDVLVEKYENGEIKFE
jgi:hypothetical protein